MSDVNGLALDADDREILRHPALGGIILFARNYANRAQLQDLIAEIRQCRPGVLIAVDQEGGRVQRFRRAFTELPTMHSIGQCFDRNSDTGLSLAETCGELMALELIELGIDISFAPVLDLYLSESSVIGDRAFHHDPDKIAVLAGAFISGMNRAGMQATGKHFPGHGGVVEDSHNETPIDHRDLETLQQSDLIPFKKLSQRLAGIMTAHICFDQIDTELPTYSSFWLKQVLRKELSFDGLVFSDDLVMAGAATAGCPAQRAEAALAAGCDMVLVCNDHDASRQVLDQVPPGGDCLQEKLANIRGRSVATNTTDRLEKSRKSLAEFRL